MAVTDRLKDAVKVLAGKRPWGYAGSSWQIPIGWNTRAYLDAYGEIGWLFGCVSRIGQAVGGAKLELYARRGDKEEDKEQLFKHPLLDLMGYVNPFQTGYEFKMLLQMYLDLVGNAFIYTVNNGLGVPAEMWLIPPSYMRPVANAESFISGWVFEAGTERIPFDLDEIIWINNPNPSNPYWGVGATQSIAVDLQTEVFSSKWNRNYFYNDAAVGTVLSYPDEVSTEEEARITAAFGSKHGGYGRAHKVAILSGGAKIEKAIISQRDMDFWKLRKLNRDNILGAFGMPLSVMGISENVNRANAESGEYVFSKWTITPRLELIDAKLTEQLAKKRYDPKLEVHHASVVPADQEQARKERDSGVNNGYMSANEARCDAGLDPWEQDFILIPINKVAVPVNDKGKFPEGLPAGAPAGGKSPQQDSQTPKEGKAKQYETPEQKEAYWLRYVQRVEKAEEDIITQLKKMFRKQEVEALSNLTESGGADQTLINQRTAKAAYTEAVTDGLTALLAESFEEGEDLDAPETPHEGSKAYHRKQEDVPPAFAEAMKWLKTRIGWAAEEVGEETAALLADQLAAGFQAGESMDKISKRVRGVFVECDKVRSLRIARTETIMASNEGALHGYSEAGVERAEFVVAADARTCSVCNGLEGTKEELKDAHGIIPVHPNCRCTWVPVVGGG